MSLVEILSEPEYGCQERVCLPGQRMVHKVTPHKRRQRLKLPHQPDYTIDSTDLICGTFPLGRVDVSVGELDV